jgi:hypothetical protein
MPKRVAERFKREPCALYHPGAGGHVVPDPTQQYADDDPLVLANAWYFADEGEVVPPRPDSVPIQAPVERATAAPGEKRATRRGQK